MEFEVGNHNASWKFIQLTEKFIQLKCFEGTGQYKGWNLESANFEENNGEVISMTLKSH